MEMSLRISRPMKIRHAAVLAVAGWYLMVPPLDMATHKLNPDEPLAAWHNFGSYDHASACSSDREKQLNFWLSKGSLSEGERLTVEGLQSYQCIATDDPRLR
jgi:hypothetical protein